MSGDLVFSHTINMTICNTQIPVDLEKAYDGVDSDGIWEILKVYGIGAHTLRAFKSF